MNRPGARALLVDRPLDGENEVRLALHLVDGQRGRAAHEVIRRRASLFEYGEIVEGDVRS